jgi:hypothetical protein
MLVYSFVIIIFDFSIANLLKFFNPIDALLGVIYLFGCKSMQEGYKYFSRRAEGSYRKPYFVSQIEEGRYLVSNLA